jgi:hypothetical protein
MAGASAKAIRSALDKKRLKAIKAAMTAIDAARDDLAALKKITRRFKRKRGDARECENKWVDNIFA